MVNSEDSTAREAEEQGGEASGSRHTSHTTLIIQEKMAKLQAIWLKKREEGR